MVEQRVAEWRKKFGQLHEGKEIVALTGETSAVLRLLKKGDVIVCTLRYVERAAISSGHVDIVTVGRSLKMMAATEECSKHWPAHCR